MRTSSLVAAVTAAVVLGTGGAAVAVGNSTAKPAEGAAAVERLLASAGDGTSRQYLGAAPIGRSGVRISGTDRYSTAVAVSQESWSAGEVSTVYLASGENYPDALAAGASTLLQGPLLLTRRDVLPAAVADELRRLQPCLVVVVGGAGAVSDAVAAQAEKFADTSRCEEPAGGPQADPAS